MPLSVSRRKFESIQIGSDITITITDICGNNVRLDIDAPKEIAINYKHTPRGSNGNDGPVEENREPSCLNKRHL